MSKERRQELIDANYSDVVTCCLACDIDYDGEKEVLIGTYGQVFIFYYFWYYNRNKSKKYFLFKRILIS